MRSQMILSHVTISGADNKVNPEDLKLLTKKYPFVEWGILYAPNQAGSPRFPTLDWVESLKLPRLSLHICGNASKKFLFDEIELPNLNADIVRIQVNANRRDLHSANFENIVKTLCKLEKPPTEVILQYRGGEKDKEMAETLAALNRVYDVKFALLHDGSGGNGILPANWLPTIPGVRTGYAGGLNPDNLLYQLKKIEQVVGDAEIYIDMETGVRTDNLFSVSKVERCLEIASMWVINDN